jgi:hypothetical protein
MATDPTTRQSPIAATVILGEPVILIAAPVTLIAAAVILSAVPVILSAVPVILSAAKDLAGHAPIRDPSLRSG